MAVVPGNPGNLFDGSRGGIYLRNFEASTHYEPVFRTAFNSGLSIDNSKEQDSDLPEEQLDTTRVSKNAPAFELAAVVVHKGHSTRSGQPVIPFTQAQNVAISGHYTSYIRTDKQWLLCNDDNISKVSERKVKMEMIIKI